MLKLKNENKKELAAFSLILLSFILYYFDLLKDGMLMSGALVVFVSVYMAIIWSEKVKDERDVYIRSEVDRYLYICSIAALLISVIFKTFSHNSYMSEIITLTTLAAAKVIISNIIKKLN